MERSEPTLFPEWLRSTGSVTGGGSSSHHSASTASHSDGPLLAHHTRNRTSKSTGDFDAPRSAFLDRTSSSNSRRSSSNGSAKHAYSSFNRGHRDKDREKEKERSNFGDHWDRDCSDPLGSIFPNRLEKDTLRRSQSLVSRKQGEPLSRKVAVESKNSSSNNHNGNGALSGGGIGSSIQKTVFEKDFPSLGTEEKQGVPDIGRVSSPGLTTAVHSLPVGSTALIGGEGWTSALAEVPTIIGGSSSSSSSTGSLSVQQTVAPASGSGASSAMAGLNMAEALAQAPSRVRTTPQLSVNTQRLEELAIKQSRQLIPVTPPMPKTSALNSTDKSKPKTAVRTTEVNVAAKSGQQQPSLQNANQSLRSGHVKSDASKTSHGKFLVLKVPWENGVSTSPKDVASPTNNAPRTANSQPPVTPSAASTPLRSPNNLKNSSLERKVAAFNQKSGFKERRPSSSQVQSRNDFFNRLKKQTSTNTSTVLPDSGPVISSPTMEKSDEIIGEVISAPASPHATENGAEVTSNGDACEVVQRFSVVGEDNISSSATICPDEEEAAFLRSLGWEENSGEDEGLTEEEINSFYQRIEIMKLNPSLCRGVQPMLSKLSESHLTSLGGASSELSPPDSGSEA